MSPYEDLPRRSFWKSGVARSEPGAIRDLYLKKFDISAEDRIATAGSCFAQHITGKLRASGYAVLDMEPAPPWLPEQVQLAHGYGLFSARYGNIYTARQLLQLAREAYGEFTPSQTVWERKGRHHDAQRPTLDPRGLDSANEVLGLRLEHLKQVRRMFSAMDVFVFTLGLTEAWMNAAGDTVYPTAPGTFAGAYRTQEYRFHNFTYPEVLEDLEAFIELISAHNPDFRMILTVSPVPLTATATDQHVLAATVHSKSVLRAVAGQLAGSSDRVDYFPSYELISSHVSRGALHQENLRTVSATGVEAVMKMFFNQHPVLDKHGARAFGDAQLVPEDEEAEVRCDEELLEAFGR